MTIVQARPVSLSVALVTRNRPRSLERCLASWRRQADGPDEIVVSDDSDDAGTVESARIAREYACRYIRGPRRGLYANRNQASLASSGSHIISADDDHTHPADYSVVVRDLIATDPGRVWIFSERDAASPEAPLSCPPELHRSGMGCSPRDPSRCAAIADGTSVYPREVFDTGLRYDERFAFGGLWYLWGKLLAARGWRISYSPRTFVFHHLEPVDPLPGVGRTDDPERLREQMLAMTYVQFTNALWVDRSPGKLGWALAYLCRRMLAPDSIIGFRVRSRIPLLPAVRAVRAAYAARAQYQLQ